MSWSPQATLPLEQGMTRSVRRPWLLAALMAAGVFVAIAPTLSWLEFSNSMENLNVGTVLEIRRGGPLLAPTLEGRRRIEKPPLTAWITALGVRSSTLARLDDPDDNARAAAYRELAFDVRWSALLASCITLLAVYSLGRTLADTRTGLTAACICASCYYFLRFSRNATTDVHLLMWVSIANAIVARAIFAGVNWTNALCAGAAIGLAFMTKGPVALVQTIIPAMVFVTWRQFRSADRRAEWRGAIARCWPAVFAAVVVGLGLGLGWFLVVARRDPQMIRTWLHETNPAGAERMRSGNVFAYAILLPFMLPWTAFLIDGIVRSFVELKQSRRSDRADLRMAYAVTMLLTTVLIMSCFQDRKDRYLLPMIGMAGVIAARGVMAMLDREAGALPDWAHWLTLMIFAFAPLLGTDSRIASTVDGKPWYTLHYAMISVMSACAIIGLGMLFARRWRGAMVAAGVAMMLFLQAVGVQGYRQSRQGRSDMRRLAESIRHVYPDAEMYNWRADGQQKRASVDLSIYMNRITRWIADPAALPRGNRPQIYLTLHRKGTPQPEPPPDWVFFDKTSRDKDWYVAFVRAASPQR